jgi:hypothetical protein
VDCDLDGKGFDIVYQGKNESVQAGSEGLIAHAKARDPRNREGCKVK